MWLLNCSSFCDTHLESNYFFKEMFSIELILVLLLQLIAELSPPSYIPYTLLATNHSPPIYTAVIGRIQRLYR